MAKQSASQSDPSAKDLARHMPAAYLRAFEAILTPLVRLMIAVGLQYPTVEAMLQRVYLFVARKHFCGPGSKPTASRLYMLTGIHRKKVAELLAQPPTAHVQIAYSLPQQVMDYLTSNPFFLDEGGIPKPLATTRAKGGELSIEALVERVSKDIRPRAILDQWLDAGIAAVDADGKIRIHSMSPHVASALKDDKPIVLERAVVPLANTVTANILNPNNEPAAVMVRVAGLSEAHALAMKREFHAELASLLARYNRRAEDQALEDLDAGTARVVLYLGAYEWIEQLVPSDER